MYIKPFPNSPINYKKGFSIMVNGLGNGSGSNISPQGVPFYYFDYDERSFQINMELEHFHNFYEMFILLSPKAQHSIEGKPYTIVNNDIVLLPPSVLHQSTYFKGPNSSRIVVDFALFNGANEANPIYNKLLSIFDKERPVLRFSPTIQETVFKPLNDIATIAMSNHDYEMRNYMIDNKFIEFLYLLWCFRDSNIYVNQEDEGMRGKVIKLTQYIHQHYKEELSLDILADEIHMNKCYLSHRFKEYTGYTVTEYIHLTRVSNAQFLLHNTNLKITNVADESGFSSFAQFNRVFQKICGVAPSVYRKKMPKTNATMPDLI